MAMKQKQIERERKLDIFPRMLVQNYECWPDSVAIRQKGLGIWNNYTWRDCYERIKYLSLGLISLGLSPGEKVVVIGNEEPEVFWAIGAIQSARAIPVPLYPDSNIEELTYLFSHSEAAFAVAEDQEQVDKMLDLQDKLPHKLRKVIYWDTKGMTKYDDPVLCSFNQTIELGKQYEESHPTAFDDNLAQIEEEDFAGIWYTSGTTGLPKGSAISHRAMKHSGRMWVETYDVKIGEDVLNLIPAGSAFEQWFGGCHYIGGGVLHFAEEPETAVSDYREISPNLMIIGPRQWLDLNSMIQLKVADAGWLKETIYALFMPVGHKMANMQVQRKKPGLLWRILDFIGEWVLFRPTRDKIGLVKTSNPVSGSSFLSPDVLKFFRAMRLSLGQIYGGTEAGLSTIHRPGDINIDTVGVPTVDTRIRISDDGEILVYSQSSFSGYYKNPEATAEKLKDGWFYTGDAGFITDEGHLVYVDRVSDLRELKSGYKYAPGYIEGRLRFSPYINEIISLGDKEKDYISVIVIIDYASVGKWAEDHHVGYTSFVDLSQKDEVGDLIKRDLERLNKLVPDESRVKKCVLLHKEFDADDAELTRLRKLRRNYIEDRYKGLINAVYQDEEQFDLEATVKYRDGRTDTIGTSLKIRTIF